MAAIAEPALAEHVDVPPWDDGSARDSDEEVVIQQNWDEIRRLMWNYVGIVRSNKRLERAMHRLNLIEQEVRDYYWNFKVTSDLLELRNLIVCAKLVVACALKRKESRGLHFTLDYPHVVESERHDTVVRLAEI
jgi:L-aspartate oxidase